MGWPKVARVEYWNALPEAISVRCPPFALLSCPLQASSSFPSRSLSLYLSSFLSVSPLCYASLHGRTGLSLFLASSYPYARLSFSFLRVPFAKLRSIFHLELRRSLAINPRIHYGLRGPYCSFFATSARSMRLARRSAYLLTCLPACAGHRLRFASRDHLDDSDASSFGYATSFPVIGPTRVFASTAVIRSCVAVLSARIARTSPRAYKSNIHVRFYNTILILLTPIFVNMCLLLRLSLDTFSMYFVIYLFGF